MATPRLTTVTHFKDLADELIGNVIDKNQLSASQKKEIDIVRTKYTPKIDALTKTITAVKKRLSTFAKKHGIKLFDGAKTGTLKTNRSRIQLRKNPASIKKIDKEANDKELILEAKCKGFGNVIIPSEVFSIEAMEKLDDEELKRIGFKRVKENYTFTIDQLDDGDLKEKVAISEKEGATK